MTHPNPSTNSNFSYLILSLYLPTFIFAFCQGLLTPILPLYAVGFEVSYGLIGLLLAGEAIGMLLGDIPAGLMMERFNQKRGMLFGLGCATLSTVALFWAASVPEALIYRLITGFSLSLFNLSRHAYMSEAITLTSRGRAIALYGGVNRIGKFIGPAVGGFVGAMYGLRAAFLLCGFICIITLIVIVIFVRVPEAHAQASMGGAHPQPGNHFAATLKRHYYVLLTAGAGQLFAQMIRAGREVIIPLYAAQVLGLGVQDVGLIVSVAAAIDMSLFYPTGIIMDRWGRKFAIVPSFLIQAIGMSLVPLTWSFTTLLLAAGLIGFGNGLGSGNMLTLGA
jgi:MFS family permease